MGNFIIFLWSVLIIVSHNCSLLIYIRRKTARDAVSIALNTYTHDQNHIHKLILNESLAKNFMNWSAVSVE